MNPYERVMAALKQAGLLRGGKPLCPTCPPSKRRGFDVTEVSDRLGRPSVLIHCFRSCGYEEILEAVGLDPADLYDGGVRQEMLFDGERFCRITTRGWKALPPSVARTFGIAASIGSFPSSLAPYTLLRSPGAWAAVRREAGIDDGLLRVHIKKWIACEMAHRCFERGVLTLFRGPLERCPNCGRPTREGSLITRKYTSKGASTHGRRHDPGTTQGKVRSHTVKGAFAHGQLFPEGDGAPDWGNR